MLSKIKHVDLIHFCHSDYGFTDHPVICQDLHRRYIDVAVDAALATKGGPEEGRFCWTAEVGRAVRDWWDSASPTRRQDLSTVIASGQLDVGALPMHQTPTLSAKEWQKMVHWLPEELWKICKPQVVIQNDVNGMPRAGAAMLLDRGVKYFFTGLNPDSGASPFPRPTAFWWKMPDGRRMFVWLGLQYCDGFGWFNPETWRRGPVPEAYDTRYRPPRDGEILQTDEASMRKAHAQLLSKAGKLEEQGYHFPSLLISMTNEWRIDSDPPFPALADFVAAWQRLGLQPSLRLTTATTALQKMEKEIGQTIPEYAGEWTDYWANGSASAPREVTASRMAKRVVAAAESPLWGPLDPKSAAEVDEIYEDLCLFDEHTWGHSHSVALPDSLGTLGQFNEKSRYAWLPLAKAQWLLSRRIRRKLGSAQEGFYVTNTSKLPWSGWVTMLSSCLRGDFQSLVDPATNVATPIEFRPGIAPFDRPRDPSEVSSQNSPATYADLVPKKEARFWIESLGAGETRRLLLSEKPGDPAPRAGGDAGKVEVDSHGWPISFTRPGMQRPLFLQGMGDFLSVGVRGFAPRWIAKEIFAISDDAERQRRRGEALVETWATAAEKTVVEQSAAMTTYTQPLRHPRLQWATRRLEVWKNQPRARLTMKFSRISSDDPELFFVSFPLPCQGTAPRTSNGGMPFTPYDDQIPGTCRDFISIDDYVEYPTPLGRWLWVSRDAPLVTFGGQHMLAHRTDAPADTNKIMSILFDNRWYTNFVGNSHGVMEFQFDLLWIDPSQSKVPSADFADSLQSEPGVIIVPSMKENPLIDRHLFQT